MQITTAAVELLGYGVYQRNEREGGGDMTRRDGSPVEYVEVRDPESERDGGVRRFTLDRSVNGERAEAGSTQHLVMRDWVEAEAKTGTYGPYIGSKRRSLVVGFTPAKPR